MTKREVTVTQWERQMRDGLHPEHVDRWKGVWADLLAVIRRIEELEEVEGRAVATPVLLIALRAYQAALRAGYDDGGQWMELSDPRRAAWPPPERFCPLCGETERP